MFNKGFSLIELMVTVAILSTLSVLIFPNLKSFKSDQEFKEAVLNMQEVIKVAQTNAFNGVKINNTTEAKNWCVEFGSSVYALKANCQQGQTPVQIKEYQLSPHAIEAVRTIGTYINPTSAPPGGGFSPQCFGCAPPTATPTPTPNVPVRCVGVTGVGTRRVIFTNTQAADFYMSNCFNRDLELSTAMDVTLKSQRLEFLHICISRVGRIYVQENICY